MGSGKSVVGKRLSRMLKREYVDMDKVIEDRTGMSIRDIFSVYGEDYFRRKEKELLKEIGGEGEKVVATGGGVVISEENWEILKKGITIYLKISSEEAWKRLKEVEDRPLLLDKDRKKRIESLLQERESFYEKANFIVSSEGRSIEDVVDEIIGIIQNERN